MQTLLWYRKIAQIAHRDGDDEIKELAARYLPAQPGDRGLLNFANRTAGG